VIIGVNFAIQAAVVSQHCEDDMADVRQWNWRRNPPLVELYLM